MDNYINGLGVFVGEFNEAQLKNGDDKVALEQMRNKTGLEYVNTEFSRKNGAITGLKLYVCTLEDMKI